MQGPSKVPIPPYGSVTPVVSNTSMAPGGVSSTAPVVPTHVSDPAVETGSVPDGVSSVTQASQQPVFGFVGSSGTGGTGESGGGQPVNPPPPSVVSQPSQRVSETGAGAGDVPMGSGGVATPTVPMPMPVSDSNSGAQGGVPGGDVDMTGSATPAANVNVTGTGKGGVDAPPTLPSETVPIPQDPAPLPLPLQSSAPRHPLLTVMLNVDLSLCTMHGSVSFDVQGMTPCPVSAPSSLCLLSPLVAVTGVLLDGQPPSKPARLTVGEASGEGSDVSVQPVAKGIGTGGYSETAMQDKLWTHHGRRQAAGDVLVPLDPGALPRQVEVAFTLHDSGSRALPLFHRYVGARSHESRAYFLPPDLPACLFPLPLPWANTPVECRLEVSMVSPHPAVVVASGTLLTCGEVDARQPSLPRPFLYQCGPCLARHIGVVCGPFDPYPAQEGTSDARLTYAPLSDTKHDAQAVEAVCERIPQSFKWLCSRIGAPPLAMTLLFVPIPTPRVYHSVILIPTAMLPAVHLDARAAEVPDHACRAAFRRDVVLCMCRHLFGVVVPPVSVSETSAVHTLAAILFHQYCGHVFGSNEASVERYRFGLRASLLGDATRLPLWGVSKRASTRVTGDALMGCADIPFAHTPRDMRSHSFAKEASLAATLLALPCAADILATVADIYSKHAPTAKPLSAHQVGQALKEHRADPAAAVYDAVGTSAMLTACSVSVRLEDDTDEGGNRVNVSSVQIGDPKGLPIHVPAKVVLLDGVEYRVSLNLKGVGTRNSCKVRSRTAQSRKKGTLFDASNNPARAFLDVPIPQPLTADLGKYRFVSVDPDLSCPLVRWRVDQGASAYGIQLIMEASSTAQMRALDNLAGQGRLRSGSLKDAVLQTLPKIVSGSVACYSVVRQCALLHVLISTRLEHLKTLLAFVRPPAPKPSAFDSQVLCALIEAASLSRELNVTPIDAANLLTNTVPGWLSGSQGSPIPVHVVALALGRLKTKPPHFRAFYTRVLDAIEHCALASLALPSSADPVRCAVCQSYANLILGGVSVAGGERDGGVDVASKCMVGLAQGLQLGCVVSSAALKLLTAVAVLQGAAQATGSDAVRVAGLHNSEARALASAMRREVAPSYVEALGEAWDVVLQTMDAYDACAQAQDRQGKRQAKTPNTVLDSPAADPAVSLRCLVLLAALDAVASAPSVEQRHAAHECVCVMLVDPAVLSRVGLVQCCRAGQAVAEADQSLGGMTQVELACMLRCVPALGVVDKAGLPVPAPCPVCFCGSGCTCSTYRSCLNPDTPHTNPHRIFLSLLQGGHLPALTAALAAVYGDVSVPFILAPPPITTSVQVKPPQTLLEETPSLTQLAVTQPGIADAVPVPPPVLSEAALKKQAEAERDAVEEQRALVLGTGTGMDPLSLQPPPKAVRTEIKEAERMMSLRLIKDSDQMVMHLTVSKKELLKVLKSHGKSIRISCAKVAKEREERDAKAKAKALEDKARQEARRAQEREAARQREMLGLPPIGISPGPLSLGTALRGNGQSALSSSLRGPSPSVPHSLSIPSAPRPPQPMVLSLNVSGTPAHTAPMVPIPTPTPTHPGSLSLSLGGPSPHAPPPPIPPSCPPMGISLGSTPSLSLSLGGLGTPGSLHPKPQ
ncbi:hypothetical protein KIPB_002985 [Kipferlia bialata]|uniref:Uncharacterized protein n=1 Tax=Kipferlia bialata TaxID=797122 RepID=A0A9K3CTR4_9EUKA|nr:hypothetical protein KIPB_001677 [Kipferlia bialata]GIQ81940.1 hypothetical protein KIPB_002985 [Kipferlia bialata]|eukprot:g1677.t1